ncbi:MAG: ATP12 family chaperone protein [Notoacmeibacter sp.]|nr:ATP12 family chaperone protein [Notoacmeibacter sp.]
MREILTDLEDDIRLSDADPVRRAQKQMLKPLPKRFYKSADVAPVDDGYAVNLDGKSVKTPARKPLVMPSEAAARLVADEFARQADVIDPATMPVTRLVNTALDGVAADIQAVAEDILRFSASDLLCYRADTPQSLVERQNEAWDPIMGWVRDALGARFVLAEGVMHVEQPREAVAAVGIHLRQYPDAFRIACLHTMTTLTGSALLALAVGAGEIDVETAWAAAHVDEDWNIQQWGEDHEASARRRARFTEMKAAVDFLHTII